MSFDITTLVTDRTYRDVTRLKELSAKGWERMDEFERDEWLTGLTYTTLEDSDGALLLDSDGQYMAFDIRGGNGQKGAYNATDMNRVNAAVVFVGSALSGVANGPAIQSTNVTCAVSDIPTGAQLYTYLENIKATRQNLQQLLSYYGKPLEYPLPELPETMTGLTYEGTNSIEQVLKTAVQELELLYNRLYWLCSGDIYTGEV